MTNFAPVLIPTLNRYSHFKRCVKSLGKCTHANKTILYIAHDYPSHESHWVGYNKISNFLPNIDGFKEVIIIKRDENFGVRKNVNDARRKIYEKFDRSIFSEDDNEFAPNFLDYLNKGLDKFEYNNDVLAICGYNWPIEMPTNYYENYFYYKALSAWGYASWKNRNLKMNYSIEEIIQQIRNRYFLFESYKYYGLSRLFKLLQGIKQGKHADGDGAAAITLLMDNKYCIFPTISKVRNFGHDGSGVHCNVLNDNIYAKQQIDVNNEFFYSDSVTIYKQSINNKIRKHYTLSIKNKFWLFFEYLLFLFTHTTNDIYSSSINKTHENIKVDGK